MEVLDVEEACQFLKISKQMLYRNVRSGSIPAFKMGRVWRFHKEALDNWVRAKIDEDTQARSDIGKATEAALRRGIKRAESRKKAV